MILTSPKPAAYQPSPRFPKTYAILVDWPVSPGKNVTVFAACDGTASLYTSSGPVYIGGGAHKSIHDAAVQLIGSANGFYDQGAPVSKYPYPGMDHVFYYFLGYHGIRRLSVDLDPKRMEVSDCPDLWLLSQRVIEQFRLVAGSHLK
jgi:hypothetical protein